MVTVANMSMHGCTFRIENCTGCTVSDLNITYPSYHREIHLRDSARTIRTSTKLHTGPPDPPIPPSLPPSLSLRTPPHHAHTHTHARTHTHTRARARFLFRSRRPHASVMLTCTSYCLLGNGQTPFRGGGPPNTTLFAANNGSISRLSIQYSNSAGLKVVGSNNHVSELLVCIFVSLYYCMLCLKPTDVLVPVPIFAAHIVQHCTMQTMRPL